MEGLTITAVGHITPNFHQVLFPCTFSSRIERSRQILPAITRAADDCPKGYKLNWKYFFDLLFTRKNIKLVHVGCHIKGEHEGCKCQDRYFYVKSKS